MARTATRNEVAAAYCAFEKLETFCAVQRVAREFFARDGVQPITVELEVEIGSEYDDEGGAFTTISIIAITAKSAAGTRLEPFDPETCEPLEDDEELKDQLIGFEWDLHRNYYASADRCLVDLLEPPPTPLQLFVIGDSAPIPERT